MAKTNLAPFAQNKRALSIVAATAKTIYNDTANTALLVTAGAEGAILRRITAIPRATVTATQLQLYRSTDAGVSMQLWRTKLMPAATMASTTEMPVTDIGLDFELATALAAGERIYCAIGVALAAGIVFTAEFEDF